MPNSMKIILQSAFGVPCKLSYQQMDQRKGRLQNRTIRR
jgi:hypothetical protein